MRWHASSVKSRGGLRRAGLARRWISEIIQVSFVFTMLCGCAESQEVVGLTPATRVGNVLGEGHLEGYMRAEKVRHFQFPFDHGPHPSYRSEWWYVTATLRNASGEEFGVQFTQFRQALKPSGVHVSGWHSGQVYMAHLAVADIERRRHRHATRLSRAHPQGAGVELKPSYRVYIEDWSLAGSVDEQVQLRLDAGDGDFALQLSLSQTQPIVLQGNQGLSAKGPEQASYYYSIPSLAVSGTITLAGTEHTVTGKAWLDREWSTSVLRSELNGWDWFALHLDNGDEAMLFQLRRDDCARSAYDQAIYLNQAEVRQDFTATDFSLTPTRFWQDDQAARWPVAWTMDLSGRRLEVRALLDDQLMDVGLKYWEGMIGIWEQGQRIGSGYMELTGYDGADACGV